MTDITSTSVSGSTVDNAQAIIDSIDSSKVWYKSKTLWFGIIQLGIALAEFFSANPGIGIVLGISGVLTVILRFVTSTSLTN